MQRVAELERTLDSVRETNAGLQALAQIRWYLLSNIAHELRALLVTVRGYPKMILEERAGTISPKQREYLTVVLENANRMVGLVNGSLGFITNQEILLESFDLRELWEASLRMVQAEALERSVKITEAIPPEPFVVTGDRQKLGVVLEGLVAHAIRLGTGEGEITVEFSRGNQQEVTVKVSDTGAGISPDALDGIFDHYPRGAPSFADGEPGFGTELPLLRDIIWLHGGRIFAASKPGEGMTVGFTLPAIGALQHEEGEVRA